MGANRLVADIRLRYLVVISPVLQYVDLRVWPHVCWMSIRRCAGVYLDWPYIYVNL